jgi:CcmD family protein
MNDAFKVLAVVLIVWVGIFLYLLKLDRDITRLKRQNGPSGD